MRTAGHPRCERGAALAILVVLIVILLASAAILWPRFSEYRKDFDKARQELAASRAEVRSLKQRPSVGEHEELQKRLDAMKKALGDSGNALAERTRAFEDGQLAIAGLEAELEGAKADADALTGKLSETREQVKVLVETRKRLEADLLTTVESYENARRAASGKEDLLDKLDSTAKRLSASERALAAEREALAEKNEDILKLQSDIDKLKADISERDAALSRLRKELAEIPIMPLPDELAKEKYHEYLNNVAEYTDRASRMAMLFRAKIALAGSAYEAKADAQWRREMKMKLEDVDRAARLVYDDVSSKVRVHPDAHDENVTLLQEALEKISGTRYERIVQQLIDREHELKAVGR